MPNYEAKGIYMKEWFDGDWDDLRPPPLESSPQAGSLRLWSAVVRRAVEDSEGRARFLVHYQGKTTTQKAILARCARRWLLSPQVEPGSFRWICQMTGADWLEARSRHAERIATFTGEREDEDSPEL